MTFARPPGPLGPPVLTCDDLAYSYGDRQAVAGLTFAVHPGEAYGLLVPTAPARRRRSAWCAASANPTRAPSASAATG